VGDAFGLRSEKESHFVVDAGLREFIGATYFSEGAFFREKGRKDFLDQRVPRKSENGNRRRAETKLFRGCNAEAGGISGVRNIAQERKRQGFRGKEVLLREAVEKKRSRRT